MSTKKRTRLKMQAVFPERDSEPFSIKNEQEFEKRLQSPGWIGVKARLLKEVVTVETEVLQERVGGQL